MPEISALFWDVGGVLLTNAWDRSQRERALEQFHLDEAEFQDRHEMLVSSLERGKIGFDEYLDRTVFYRPRPFAREVFKDYVFSLSQPHREVLAVAEQLARSGKYFMGTINNESKELNQYRIQTFWLHWKQRKNHRRLAASSTIGRSTSTPRSSWECIPSRCMTWNSCEETYESWKWKSDGVRLQLALWACQRRPAGRAGFHRRLRRGPQA